MVQGALVMEISGLFFPPDIFIPIEAPPLNALYGRRAHGRGIGMLPSALDRHVTTTRIVVVWFDMIAVPARAAYVRQPIRRICARVVCSSVSHVG